VGADDEAFLLAGEDRKAGNGAIACAGFDALYDRAKFFERAATQCVLALAFTIEDGPGDLLFVDRESPVSKAAHIGHGRPFALITPRRHCARQRRRCGLASYSAA